ncbi:MAG: hypothetical protein RDV48_26240 [Candidatus Eremiobacteraeota bacterium]|nr:hypothetical protein [Candidatus Eremiobacteraeota bacterium]
MRKERLPELISEIRDELGSLQALVSDIKAVNSEIPDSEHLKNIYKESLTLKLHNFYTGCERIFRRIADDINSGVPKSLDWHKRLLKIMSLDIEGKRPAVISKETESRLEEFLAFRHVVRNMYGFEIRYDRLRFLVEETQGTFEMVKEDMEAFIGFLEAL